MAGAQTGPSSPPPQPRPRSPRPALRGGGGPGWQAWSTQSPSTQSGAGLPQAEERQDGHRSPGAGRAWRRPADPGCRASGPRTGRGCVSAADAAPSVVLRQGGPRTLTRGPPTSPAEKCHGPDRASWPPCVQTPASLRAPASGSVARRNVPRAAPTRPASLPGRP